MEQIDHIKVISLLAIALELLHIYNPKNKATKGNITKAITVLNEVIKELPKDTKIINEIKKNIALLKSKKLNEATIKNVITFIYHLIIVLEETSIPKCTKSKIKSALTFPSNQVEIQTEINC